MDVPSGRAVLSVEIAAPRPGAGGPDVLFLHAGVTDQRSWGPVVQQLSGSHRCITFDERGFGSTTYEPEDGWTPADDALHVLDATEVSRAVLVGSSIGGATALDLAITHPDRVAALVLIAPVVRDAPYPPPTTREAELEEQAERAQEAGDLDEANRLEARLWLDGPTSDEGRVGGEARALFLEMNRGALGSPNPGRLGPRPAVWPVLEALPVPVLAVVGDRDVSEMRSITGKLAERIPTAQFVRIPDVAHLPQLETPGQLALLLRDFMDSLDLA